MESKKLCDIDLTELGFVNDTLETEYHIVSYVFYDIGRLMIQSKPKCGGDEVYIEDYFELDKFINIIFYVTGFKIKTKALIIHTVIVTSVCDNCGSGDIDKTENYCNNCSEYTDE